MTRNVKCACYIVVVYYYTLEHSPGMAGRINGNGHLTHINIWGGKCEEANMFEN